MFAFVLESVGSGEWLVLLAVILIVVGPKNLPSAARKMGQVMSKLRRAADEFKRQLLTMDDEMKRAADEIKRDYIDIPEDSSTDHAAAEIGDADAESHDDGYGDIPDYPGDYPEEDYYGLTDENGLEVPSAPEGDAAADPAQAEVAGGAEQSGTADVPIKTEKTDGEDTGNT